MDENGETGLHFSRMIKLAVSALALAALAACATQAPPPPPPPPPAPPPAVYVPPRPQPPEGAAQAMTVPPLGPDGVRETVNARLSLAQAVWNLRSAYNVAALNCLKPGYAEILVGYKRFLKVHKRGLGLANQAINSEFRGKYGANFIRPREIYLTQVYNYYAFPATMTAFCDAALGMARQSMTTTPAELAAFSRRSITMMDQVFETFFRAYEQYRADAAAWDARYALIPGVSGAGEKPPN